MHVVSTVDQRIMLSFDLNLKFITSRLKYLEKE